MTGIGFRKDFAEAFLESQVLQPDFIEVAPENWIGLGGYWNALFRRALERYPLFTHGLSLSIGSPDPLNWDLLKAIKHFLDDTQALVYSEHLSYSSCDNAHLYDLLPIPFTEEAVAYVSKRIKQVQEFLERPLAIEIVSYYSPVAPQLTEIEFINAILETADCELLLDVNNIYVNSVNHAYDPWTFLTQLPKERVRYIHMAGHEKVSEDLLIDTHGSPIIDPVYHLFSAALNWLGRDVPVLLERDFNIPDLKELEQEILALRAIKQHALNPPVYANS